MAVLSNRCPRASWRQIKSEVLRPRKEWATGPTGRYSTSSHQDLPQSKRRVLFQLGILDPFGDLLCDRMPERPGGSCPLRVEIGTDRVFVVDDLLARAVGDSILNVRSLAAGAQADDDALGGVARMPGRDLSIEDIDRALRGRGGFPDDVELLTQHGFELRDELCLHLFHVVGQRNT